MKRINPTRRLLGFSMLEMAVALAMAGIIVAAGVSAGMQLNGSLVETRKRLALRDEAKRLEEALLSMVQQAGGDPLRPQEALRVENNGCPAVGGLPACPAAKDRLTVVTVDDVLPACKVVGTSGANLEVFNSGATTATCCLFPGGVAASPFEGQTAMLVKDDGTVLDLHLHNVHSVCRVNVPPGFGNPSPSDLDTGTLVVVRRRVLYTQPDPSLPGALQLVQWEDKGSAGTPANATVDPGETALIADHVYDFQVALGYDGAPADGNVVDNASASDEWEFAVPGDALPGSITPDQLRMVGVAVVVGGPLRTGAPPVRVFDGNTLSPPGIFTVASQSKIAIRNLNVSVP